MLDNERGIRGCHSRVKDAEEVLRRDQAVGYKSQGGVAV